MNKTKISKKLKNNIDKGLWSECGHPQDSYMASAGYNPGYVFNDDNSKKYYLSFHKGVMPAFDTIYFSCLSKLEKAMRKVEPDLRKWKTRE